MLLSKGLSVTAQRRSEVVVTLRGMPDGKDRSHETGFYYFVDHVRLEVLNYTPPPTAATNGAQPINRIPTKKMLTFQFSHIDVGGHCFYTLQQMGR